MKIENFYYQLSLAEKFLEEGKEERARDLVLSNIDDIPIDAQSCFRWAKVCEKLGLARYAIKFYRNALRADPKNSEILSNYASLLNDIGYYEDAIHYLKKAVKADPENQKPKRLLSDLLKDIGLYGQAECLEEVPSKKEPIRYFPPTIGKEHLEKMFLLFSGREVGYAIQKLDETTSDSKFLFVNKPISDETLKDHIEGKITLAVYPIRSDNTARYGCIKVKVKESTIKRNAKNKAYLSYLDEMARSYALSLVDLSYRFGIPSYVDNSGDYSYRIWFFFREFIHFLKIRRFLKNFLENAREPETYISVELLIGTKPIGVGWIENPILLPLGINLSTKKRIMFLDKEGNPIEDQLIFLKKIQQIPFKESLYSLRLNKKQEGSYSTPVLKAYIADMINRCSVLEKIVEKARSGRILSNEEKIILFYTIGIVDSEGEALHQILYLCPDYNYTKVERQRIRLKKNPISCVKIRELLPDLTSSISCSCIFDLRGGRYPSPVMHINPSFVSPKEEFIFSERTPIRDIARRYISLLRQKQEIDQAIQKANKLLERYYFITEKEQISVDGIILYREDGVWKIRR